MNNESLQSSAPKAKRTSNRNLSKVRTGCITCKIRKVKCDEGRPSCRRCTDTGRTCDGYRIIQKVTTGHGSIVATRRFMIPTDGMLLSQICTTDERHWTLYFSQCIGPALSSLDDVSFWCQILPQMSESEPAIRHAILAISSSHARFQAGLVADGTVTRGIDTAGRDFSIRHHNMAINKLREALVGGTVQPDTSLICCLLFTCLECLLGDRASVLNHIRCGLNILRSDASKSQTFRYSTQKVHDILQRLDAQSTLWGKPATQTAETLDITSMSTLSENFTNIADAQQSLEMLVSLTLNFVQTFRCGLYTDEVHHFSGSIVQQRIQEKLFSWKNNMDRLETSMSTEGVGIHAGVIKLRIQHSAAFIFISTCLEAAESCWDSYTSVFEQIVRWSHSLTASDRTSGTPGIMATSPDIASLPLRFSLHASIIPALYMTAIKCRDPIIRREAISILDVNPHREGIWDARLQAAVARRIVQIEEEGMSSEDGLVTAMPREHCRVYRSDIEKTFDRPLQSVHATFFTAPKGISAQWKMWSEDIPF